MSVEFDRGSPGKFDSRTLNRKTLNRWTGRKMGKLKWVTRSVSFSCHDPLDSPKASALRQLFVLSVFA